MLGVLDALEAFRVKTQEIFDRVDQATDNVEAQLTSLEERLEQVSSRVQASRGSTHALTVLSSNRFGGHHVKRTSPMVFNSKELASITTEVPFPNEGSTGPPLLFREASEHISTMMRAVAPVDRGRSGAIEELRNATKLHEPGERLTSVSELLLVNSREQPYSNYRPVDNFSHLLNDQVKPPIVRTRKRVADNQPLDEDEVVEIDVGEEENLFYKPPEPEEVRFDNLPEVLPVGPVANIKWRQQDQHVAETDAPFWNVLNTESDPTFQPPPGHMARRLSTTSIASSQQTQRSGPMARRLSTSSIASTQPSHRLAPPAPTPAEARVPAAPVQKMPSVPKPPPLRNVVPPGVTKKGSEPSADTPEVHATPQVPKKGTDKGKGKGKTGKPKPPPLPKKSAHTPAAAQPRSEPGVQALLGDLNTDNPMAKLKKTKKPVENSSLKLGRVM